MHCSPTNNNNNNNNTNNPFSLSLSLQKRNTIPALNAKEGNVRLEYYIYARFRENVRSLKDLKISLFPLLRCASKERRHKKNVFRVTVIFFLVSRLPKNFWSSAGATFEEGLPPATLEKRSKKKT